MQSCFTMSVSLLRTGSIWSIIKASVMHILAFLYALNSTMTRAEESRKYGAHYSREELEQIVLDFKDMVYRLAVMRMQSQSLADDIFQETFLKLVKHNKRFETEEHLKAWLIRVTINCCKDYYRSAWHHNVVSFIDERRKGDTEYAGEEDTETSDDNFYDPFEAGNPLSDITFEAVQSLSDNLREVIHLFYYESMSVREIAVALGVRENAIKTRLSRARAILKDKLEGVYHG